MRSIWKGHIRFSLVTIPVRIYNAIDSGEAIHFNQLHKEDGGPIGYEKKCKVCANTVTNDEIVKGYQFEKDQYIIVEPADLEKVKLKTTRVVEIEGFVDKGEIEPTLYDAAYFAGPDGDVSVKSYAILRAALEESGKVGLGKVVLRDREEMVAIAPHKDGIVMYKLHYPKEMRNIEDVPQIDHQQKVDESALKLAHNLIDTMTTSVDKIEMRDRYAESLREIFDAKIQGREVVTPVEKEQPTVDIMAALRESIEQAKAQRKPMVKATGAKKEAQAEEEAAGREAAGKSRKRKSG
ncbi:MAG TPA: Ku protein [Blastocatellia bacterium]|nr:Ku protein [Blastocatellia bacterium]